MLIIRPEPPPNPHTIYLEGLLTPRSLLLTLKSGRGDGSQLISTQYRSITNVGLLLGNAIQNRLDIPVLQLPPPSEAQGSLERVIQGELLEAIWYDLTPEAKYGYARQLRRIVNNMRGGMTSIRTPATTVGKTNLLGSAFSGPYCLPRICCFPGNIIRPVGPDTGCPRSDVSVPIRLPHPLHARRAEPGQHCSPQ